MTPDVFAKILTVLCEAYRLEFTESQQQVWWAILKELDNEQAIKAAIECCRTSKYPPKPADIWTRCQPQDGELLDAIVGWRCARDAIADPKCVMPNVVKHVVGLLGGRVFLGQLPEEMLERYTRPQFLKIYQALKKSGHMTSEVKITEHSLLPPSGSQDHSITEGDEEWIP